LGSQRPGSKMGSLDQKLEQVLSHCENLLREESESIANEDLDRLEEVGGRKDEALAKLIEILKSMEDVTSLDDADNARMLAILDQTDANSRSLADWMEHMDREIGLISRGRNRLKGLRHAYVTLPRKGFLDRSQNFEA